MPIQRIGKKLLTDEVSAQLKTMILSGEYAPGDRLPTIHELADSLGVALTTVREGLRQIESLGLIRIQHGSGVFVTEMIKNPIVIQPMVVAGELQPQVLADLLDVRRMLETNAAELAAQNASPTQIEVLQGVFAEMEAYSDDPALFSQADTRFHLYVAEMSGNRILQLMLEAVADMIVRHQERLNVSNELRERSLRHHGSLWQAIANREPGKARIQMAAHLDDIREELGRRAEESCENPAD